MRLAGRHGLVLQHVNPRIGKALAPVDSSTWVPPQEELEAALLPPGMQQLTLHELRDLAVAAFPASRRGARLWGAFDRFFAALSRANVAREIWVGGSFLTRTADPKDVDLVAVLVPERMEALGSERASELYEELLDQGALLAEGLDVSAMFDGDLILRAYWQGVFGFGRGTRAKGIAIVPTPTLGSS